MIRKAGTTEGDDIVREGTRFYYVYNITTSHWSENWREMGKVQLARKFLPLSVTALRLAEISTEIKGRWFTFSLKVELRHILREKPKGIEKLIADFRKRASVADKVILLRYLRKHKLEVGEEDADEKTCSGVCWPIKGKLVCLQPDDWSSPEGREIRKMSQRTMMKKPNARQARRILELGKRKNVTVCIEKRK